MSSKNKPSKKNSYSSYTEKHAVNQRKAPAKAEDAPSVKPIKAPQKIEEPIQAVPLSKKLVSAIPYAVAVIIFLLVWTENKTEVIDPWYAAVRLVDSSNRVTDPDEKLRILEEGGSQLRELVAEHPYHARVHFFYGYYFLTSQKWDSAIAEFAEAVRIDTLSTVNPVWFDAVNMLAVASLNKANGYLQNSKIDEAMNALQFAKLYSPNHRDVNHNIAVIFHNTGRLDSAVVYYEQALSADPNDQQIRENLSNAYFVMANRAMQERNFKLAAPLYQRAVELNPNNISIIQNAVLAFEAMGDNNTANALRQKLAN